MKTAIGRTILFLALLGFVSGTLSTYSTAQTVPQSGNVASEPAASTIIGNKDVRLRNLSLSDDFHMEEFKALRGEILLLKQHQFNIQQWVFITVGLIYALAFRIKADAVTGILPTIPKRALFFAALVVTAFGAGLYVTNDYVMYNISEYIKQIETGFTAVNGPNGWEHFQGNDAKRHVWGLWSPFWIPALIWTGGVAAAAFFFPRALPRYFRD